MTKEKFISQCMKDAGSNTYYVSNKVWFENIELIKELKSKGYDLSISQVDSLENI